MKRALSSRTSLGPSSPSAIFAICSSIDCTSFSRSVLRRSSSSNRFQPPADAPTTTCRGLHHRRRESLRRLHAATTLPATALAPLFWQATDAGSLRGHSGRGQCVLRTPQCAAAPHASPSVQVSRRAIPEAWYRRFNTVTENVQTPLLIFLIPFSHPPELLPLISVS
eukprot:10373_1